MNKFWFILFLSVSSLFIFASCRNLPKGLRNKTIQSQEKLIEIRKEKILIAKLVRNITNTARQISRRYCNYLICKGPKQTLLNGNKIMLTFLPNLIHGFKHFKKSLYSHKIKHLQNLQQKARKELSQINSHIISWSTNCSESFANKLSGKELICTGNGRVKNIMKIIKLKTSLIVHEMENPQFDFKNRRNISETLKDFIIISKKLKKLLSTIERKNSMISSLTKKLQKYTNINKEGQGTIVSFKRNETNSAIPDDDSMSKYLRFSSESLIKGEEITTLSPEKLGVETTTKKRIESTVTEKSSEEESSKEEELTTLGPEILGVETTTPTAIKSTGTENSTEEEFSEENSPEKKSSEEESSKENSSEEESDITTTAASLVENETIAPLESSLWSERSSGTTISEMTIESRFGLENTTPTGLESINTPSESPKEESTTKAPASPLVENETTIAPSEGSSWSEPSSGTTISEGTIKSRFGLENTTPKGLESINTPSESPKGESTTKAPASPLVENETTIAPSEGSSWSEPSSGTTISEETIESRFGLENTTPTGLESINTPSESPKGESTTKAPASPLVENETTIAPSEGSSWSEPSSGTTISEETIESRFGLENTTPTGLESINTPSESPKGESTTKAPASPLVENETTIAPSEGSSSSEPSSGTTISEETIESRFGLETTTPIGLESIASSESPNGKSTTKALALGISNNITNETTSVRTESTSLLIDTTTMEPTILA